MIQILKQQGFSRFEAMLGFGLLALVAMIVVPPLQVGMQTERPMRAVMEAEMVARAVLDYHTEMGHWPVTGDGQADLALLVPSYNRARTRALARTMNSATEGVLMGSMVGSEGSDQFSAPAQEKTWLKEVPVDPWDRPFRVVIMGDRTGYDHLKTENSSSGFPDVPPPGTAIVVLSSGPNGLYDTDLAQLWHSDLSGRLTLEDGSSEAESGNSFGGDDLGFVLSHSSFGGNP